MYFVEPSRLRHRDCLTSSGTLLPTDFPLQGPFKRTVELLANLRQLRVMCAHTDAFFDSSKRVAARARLYRPVQDAMLERPE